MANWSDREKVCFYCGALVSNGSTGVGDHFPVSKRHGGTATVDCCLSCHDMKDRYSLNNWPAEWTSKVMQDFPLMSRETRIFLAKLMALAQDASQPRAIREPRNG